jgi:LPS-assembly lipoprotein
MSQPRTRSQIAAKAAAALLGLLAVALSACAGFSPMYAAQGVSPKLSAIEVAPIDGRVGFFVKEYMDDALVRDPDQPAVYRLGLVNREVRVPRGITIANIASRYEVDLNTTYTLTEIATGKLITRGTVAVNVTYDVVAQPYAALSVEQDSERRVAEQAADRVRLELATFFASPRPNPSDAALKPPDASTYSFDHQAAVIQSPRLQATGQMTSGNGETDVFGQVRQAVTTPDDPGTQPFNPSEDPNAIKTLPDAGGASQ